MTSSYELAQKESITLKACHALQLLELTLARIGWPRIVSINKGSHVPRHGP
jgi:hypothetical protein